MLEKLAFLNELSSLRFGRESFPDFFFLFIKKTFFMTVNIFVLPLSTNLSLLPSYYDIEKKKKLQEKSLWGELPDSFSVNKKNEH